MNENYLLINNYFLWKITNGELEKIEIKPGIVINKKLKIYNNDSYILASSAIFENYKWNFYDENGQIITPNDYRIAYTGDYNIIPINYEKTKFETNNKITELIGELSETNLKSYEIKSRKITLDFDNDGINETIYTMDDFIFGSNNERNMTYMILEKNGQKINMISDKSIHAFNVIEIIKINNTPYLVVLKGLADPVTYRDKNYFLYTVKDNKIMQCMTKN